MPLQPAAGSTEVGPNRDNRRSIDKHLYRDHSEQTCFCKPSFPAARHGRVIWLHEHSGAY